MAGKSNHSNPLRNTTHVIDRRNHSGQLGLGSEPYDFGAQHAAFRVGGQAQFMQGQKACFDL